MNRFDSTNRLIFKIPCYIFSLYLAMAATSAQAANDECRVEFSLPQNQWHQISLPCDPGEANTTADILADDFTGIYGQDWVIYRYDAAQSAYINVGESGVLQTGIGYWVIQVSASETQLDLTGTLATEVSTAEVPQCPSQPGKCVETPLASNGNTTWNMGGLPLIARLGWQKVRIIDQDGDCADANGCTIDEAQASGIVHNQAWHYDGETYQLIDNNTPLHPWEGFWTATLDNATQAKMLLPVNYGGYTPDDQGIATFETIQPANWGDTAVRKVLHTFAYGGQATPEQIEAWANLSPEAAIIEILTFDEFNPLLSPPVPGDSANLGEKDGTLRALGEFWSSADPDNDVDEEDRQRYNVSPDTGNVRTDYLWERAVLSHGTNPFRQKIGLWETNYHLSVNRDVGVRERSVLQYYDNICNSLGSGDDYINTLNTAALSPAIAKQYGHYKNIFSDGECQCNEDFAREYHQLFFGILGVDNPDYHETISIKNTANALTDMHYIDDNQQVITFGTAQHYPGDLEILGSIIPGTRADQRITALSAVAINHPESLANLPKIIIKGLADDNLSESDLSEIRTVWDEMPEKNLLHFLRGYAISQQFHQADRKKYLNSFDRNVSIYMQTVLNNAEVNLYDAGLRFYKDENVLLFRPRHNVFGGQTGLEASNSSEVFRANYNRSTEKASSLYQSSNAAHNWEKDWASAMPDTYTQNYLVDSVGEFLWNRYIGDGLKDYGLLERTYVNALLATDTDWVTEASPDDLDRVFSVTDLTTDTHLINLRQAHASSRLALDSNDTTTRRAANLRVGKAINFIVATPFIFAQQGR